MKHYQKKRIKVQAQTILFCAACIWMLVSALAAVPTMAFQPMRSPDILSSYEDIVTYMDYAYASSEAGNEAISHMNSHKKWEVLCQSDRHFSGFELIERCNVPIGTARHLKVLKHKGMSHEMYVADL